jgi:hypothetical protein
MEPTIQLLRGPPCPSGNPGGDEDHQQHGGPDVAAAEGVCIQQLVPGFVLNKAPHAKFEHQGEHKPHGADQPVRAGSQPAVPGRSDDCNEKDQQRKQKAARHEACKSTQRRNEHSLTQESIGDCQHEYDKPKRQRLQRHT